jgi:membrane protein implicated in regulation of membrane protease activity
MRVTAFAGLITAVFNLLQWFVFNPQFWWMGVLHLPLLAISIYAFVLSLRKIARPQDSVNIHATPQPEPGLFEE